MPRFLCCVAALAVGMSLAAQTPSPVAGDWVGVLNAGGAQLHLVLHIKELPGGLTTTMDSPDQGAAGIATSATTLAGNKLTVTVAKIHGEFAGTLKADHTAIEGTWTQGGSSFPMVLTPLAAGASLVPKRPQTPQPPFPYTSEDVSYPNAKSGNTLAGTLTMPHGQGPFPAVILIAGSGPHDRDETILGHKPFLVLADALTRKGIAVLRYDKRGIGKSTGDYAAATSADFAEDAQAGLDYLHTRPEIAALRTGLLGHSEGGLIAPSVAANDPGDVAFVVLLAGPGETGLEILVAQTRLIAEANGATTEQAEKLATDQRARLKMIAQSHDDKALKQQLTASLAETGVPSAQMANALAQATSPWMRYFITYDPAPTLAKVRCPVLALGGSKDLQVPAAENLALIRKALAAGGNTHVESAELPGLNHLFQPATTGAPSEYAKIETTMDPAVLERVSTWILKQPPLTLPKK